MNVSLKNPPNLSIQFIPFPIEGLFSVGLYVGLSSVGFYVGLFSVHLNVGLFNVDSSFTIAV